MPQLPPCLPQLAVQQAASLAASCHQWPRRRACPLTHFLPSWMTMRPSVELAALLSSHSPLGTSSTRKKPTAVTGLTCAAWAMERRSQ